MKRQRLSISLTLVFLLICSQQILSQERNVTLYGKVYDSSRNIITDVYVVVEGTSMGTHTDESGNYELKLPARKRLYVKYSYLGNYRKFKIGPFNADRKVELNVLLDNKLRLKPVYITSQVEEREIAPMEKIDPKVLKVLPMTSANKVAAIIKTFAGVSSNTELSSNYSVRGGNYDENLVYINDVEIYRPFLVRSGQQEGLSIINSDLIEIIKFSAGGFEAKYGDKMSSVLDITYKTPKEFHASFSGSILGFSSHVEGASKNKNFTYLIGARQRSSKYLLSSLDVVGDYNTSFTDVQSYFTYKISPLLKLSYLFYYGRNNFNLIPENQETTYGTSNLVLRLNVYFEGQELMFYNNYLNAINLTYQVGEDTYLKFIGSVFHTQETEYFDVLGEYWLAQVDTDPGSETFQEATKEKLGVGAFLHHARNRLYADIYNIQHKGVSKLDGSTLKWGCKVQYEKIEDYLREWQMLDSADYNIPMNDQELILDEFSATEINLNSFRYSGYLQNTFTLSDSSSSFLTLGVRGNYWDFNNEYILTPRVQFVFEPFRKNNLILLMKEDTTSPKLNRNVQIKAAAGMYYQPAFYRELRGRSGVINPEIRAQKSYHLVLGSDIYFKLWERKFKLMLAIYGKYLDDIIPYDIEDIRIRYHANNDAIGYAAGLDMQLYGEFVKGLPSWVSMSFMTTKEDLEYDYKINYDTKDTVEQGFIPRPTDQVFRVSVFFQDFLPNNPTYKVHLNLVFATSLPFGPPQFEQLRNQYRMRSYKRIDIGFSKQIMTGKENHSKFKLLTRFESLWLSAEILNLFGFNNVISYFWVKDVGNNYWGVPNYLTARRFNINLIAEF